MDVISLYVINLYQKYVSINDGNTMEFTEGPELIVTNGDKRYFHPT